MEQEGFMVQAQAKFDDNTVPKNEDGTDAHGFFSHPRGHIRDRIILHETKESPKEGQFIGLNGFPFQVQYNREVDIPRPVLEMLRTRIYTEITKDEKTGEETFRNIPRFNITVIKENVGNVPVETADTKGTFSCEICGKAFDRKVALTGHMRSHEKG
jgi:hypothetical protein